MNFDNLANLAVLDCTIRDGGYLNNWKFDLKFVREVYRSLSKSGVEFAEIGYRGSDKYFDKEKYGLWRFTPEKVLRDVSLNIGGAKIALMADYGKVDDTDFCAAQESLVNLVRLAVNKEELQNALKLLEKIKRKGYKTALNAMGYTNYSKAEQELLISLVRQSGIDYLYVVDSYGSLFPYQIQPIFEPLLASLKIKIGFHPHNSLQMAFANTLEAIRCGIHIVDSTIYGMGRAAGNLPTEIILSVLEKNTADKYNTVPILNIIDRYFVKLQKENSWGYQLSYMLSGIFGCHPNYAKALIDAHEYTIEEVWKAMDYIKRKEPSGFSTSILEELFNSGVISSSGGYAGSRGAAAALKKTEDREPKDKTPVMVGYAQRHRDRDFLILANGPTLKLYREKIEKFIQKYDPVILGANYLGNLFKPDYHAFNNKRRFVDYIDSVDPASKLIIGEHIPDSMIREYTDRQYEKMRYIDSLNADFDIREGVVTTNCRTVAILLLGIAIVMGAKRVFGVGMDGYLSADQTDKSFHFYAENDEKENREMILERHRWCQKFIGQIDAYLIERNMEGLHILTPTSYKSFYKGIENYI